MREHPDYYYQQSAVIPVRRQEDGLKILMITSRRKRRWVVPKGILDPDLSPQDSAAKEAKEEAGILGTVYPKMLGTFEYEKWGGTCSVQVYVMLVTQVQDTWLESFRDRAWLDLEEAVDRVKEPDLKKMLTNKLSLFLEDRGV